MRPWRAFTITDLETCTTYTFTTDRDKTEVQDDYATWFFAGAPADVQELARIMIDALWRTDDKTAMEMAHALNVTWKNGYPE